jgi:cell division protein FtsL
MKLETPTIQNHKELRWFLLIIVLAAELICNAWIRSESSQAMIMITRTESQIRDMADYRQALSVELERLKSEARITRIARTRLSLTPDIFNQTIYLPKGTN